MRQVAPFKHGPERIEERHPHVKHIDWASMFPTEVILHGPPRKEVALTFDDGPDDVWTPRILDVLALHDVIREIMSLDYKIIFWNVDSLDGAGLTAPQVTANILAHAGPGSIVLLHSAGGRGESLEDTVEALPYVIRTLREEGYKLVTVSDLLNIPSYKSGQIEMRQSQSQLSMRELALLF
ncbi:polysaccharide deacetylase family protein [Effusibacillus dendaii]|uniref:NodB homology domain-containing protein n=1 Tax=Effusibacillus dendaii TaxID=2743772 RepID=A0A7I8D9T9_9BACL|nr:polysaccharide deacetylase family protein [Effusibacillus dendaii]BCJ86928.1 hypothetical protein skT53_19130 [Effusibacillus dendaii]